VSEQEWRLLIFNPLETDIIHSPKRESISQYIAVPCKLGSLPVRDVYVGPGRHNDITAYSIMQILAAKGMPDLIPQVSDIPFRPMI
jgi:hypothetical protein